MLGLANNTTRLEAFYLDAAVRQATAKFEKEQTDSADPSTSGAASPREKRELHDDQEQRADLRESMEQAGQQTPSPDGQLDRLDEYRDERQQAENLTEQ